MRKRSPCGFALGVVFVARLLLQTLGEVSPLLPQSVRDECLGVMVTPDVVLLPAHCAESLRNHGNNNAVVILGTTASDATKVQIQRVKIHHLYHPGESAIDFALGCVESGTLALSETEFLLDGGPEIKTQEDQVGAEDLVVYSLRQSESDQDESDPVAVTRTTATLDLSGACDTEQPANSESVICLVGKWHGKVECENNLSEHQVVVRRVNDRDYFHGFVSRSSRCNQRGEQVLVVSPVANALRFIESALPQFASSPGLIDRLDKVSSVERRILADSSFAGAVDEQPSTADPSLYEKYLVTFYEGLTPLDCSGALIASIFILTTAACALSHQITHVSFGGADGFESIVPFQTIVHPRHASGYSRFDVAILELEAPLYEQKIALSFDPGLVGDKLVRVSQDGVADQVTIDELSKCPSTELSLTPSDAVSGVLACVDQEFLASGPSPRIGNSILIQESQGELFLKGIELAVKSCLEGSQCYSGIYIGISGLANFINAFAAGQVWGSQPANPTPTPGPSPTPTPEQPTPEPISQPPPSPGPTPEFPTPEPATQPPAPMPTTPAPASHPTPAPGPAPMFPPHPYLVGLRVTKDGRNFCGGVLIGPFDVLTAARCVNDGIVSWVSIGSPTSSWSDSQDIPVEGINAHPLFQSASGLNDVAILKLGFYAESARWAELASASDFPDKTAATMATFGTMSSNTLETVGVPIWARKICEAQYPNVDGTILCAGGVSGKDACSGDSGSPLIVSDGEGKNVLVGLVSSGYGCGQAGVPGFYTRVSAVRDFITSNAIVSQSKTPAQATAPLPFAVPTDTASSSPAASPEDPSEPTATSAVTPSGTSTSGPPAPEPQTTGNTPRPEGSLKVDGISTSPTSTPSSSQISSVTLDKNLPPATQQKVLDIIIGRDAFSSVSSDLLKQLVDPDNQVVLYSTGDLQGIVDAIDRNSALPLNQRADRFGTVTVPDASSNVCASGR